MKVWKIVETFISYMHHGMKIRFSGRGDITINVYICRSVLLCKHPIRMDKTFHSPETFSRSQCCVSMTRMVESPFLVFREQKASEQASSHLDDPLPCSAPSNFPFFDVSRTGLGGVSVVRDGHPIQRAGKERAKGAPRKLRFSFTSCGRIRRHGVLW